MSLPATAALHQWGPPVKAMASPPADAAQVQRVEVARLLVELAMQSLLMRDMLQDEYDLRREQRRELLELRMKFKRWDLTAACCITTALPSTLSCSTCTFTAMVRKPSALIMSRQPYSFIYRGEICILVRACRNDSACPYMQQFSFQAGLWQAGDIRSRWRGRRH